jgi:tRNA nucleotidyltransferase (CCA-adding enzyme)
LIGLEIEVEFHVFLKIYTFGLFGKTEDRYKKERINTMLYIKIIQKLRQEKFEVYMVGGVVRDILSGVDPDDIDLVTNATPDQIRRIFEEIYSIKYKGNIFGVSIVTNGIETIEVATYRTEKSTGHGHKDFDVNFTDDLLLDIKRRDFTFNAMPMCPITCEVLDIFGGREDLKNRVVRFVGNPFERINDDPERMFRAARMAAKLRGNLTNETLQAIRAKAHLAHNISRERIRIEILKAMKCREASRFFYILYDTGLLHIILPSLTRCYKHPHGKHHFEDVFEHQMLTGDYISTKCPLIKLTGYLHDCGKPEAYIRLQDGSFIDHHKIGEEILRKELLDLKFSLKEIDFIAGLTRIHMQLRDKDPSKKAIRKFLLICNERKIHYTSFLRLRIADKMASLKKVPTYTNFKNFIRRIEECIFEEEKQILGLKDLAIDGYDIMKALNLPPGKEVGKKLKELLELVLEDPTLNEKEKLMTILKG